MQNTLVKRAQEILNENFQEGGFTIPSKKLYPFQWKWDSGFIAIGLAHYDMPRAKKEIETLLLAQWSNGFIPHIVFHTKSDTYFPGPDFHQSHLHNEAPKNYESTGMTQPPVLGFVLEKLYDISNDKKDILKFIEFNIDKIYNNHVYFYTKRDIYNEGLVYIYHNWESGTDNSPLWDDIWKTMNPPEFKFERKDTTHVDPSQRPSRREYDHYLHIIELAKIYNYSEDKIAENSPFLVQDPLFNSILMRSNEALIKLYELLGNNIDKINYLKSQNSKSKLGMNEKLFSSELGAYVHYDLRNNRQIPFVSSSSFSPLFCGAPGDQRALKLIKTLKQKFGGKEHHLCASFDPYNERFNPKKYWRGPIWINLNWILYNGFRRYNFKSLAQRIKKDSIYLIENQGFYEYFDPRKSISSEEINGYGGANFSWTAALLIDFLSNRNY